MKFGSVCSGIEAASVAWLPLGWKPAFYSEIDKFPCAILEQRHGSVPNYGDLNNFKEWPDATINLLVGGTPCQSFSVAGLRKGLDDPRGNLALTYLAVVDRYRPKWVVWENVPGVLSSGGGRDIGTFLGALGELGYGFAYRICDAQFFGVPQRRRRVFVVGYLGDWRPPAAVLFESHSLSGDPPPGREEGESVAALTANGVGTYGADDNQGQAGHLIANSITARQGKGVDSDCTTTLVPGAGFKVRRLTVKECERLQGFPDSYTKITWCGKSPDNCPDGPRYKALGNSMAVPVMAWIGRRIQLVDKLTHP